MTSGRVQVKSTQLLFFPSAAIIHTFSVDWNDWHLVKAHTFQPLVIPFSFSFAFLVIIPWWCWFLCAAISISPGFFHIQFEKKFLIQKPGNCHFWFDAFIDVVMFAAYSVKCHCVMPMRFSMTSNLKCKASDARCKSESNVKMSRELCWIECANDDHIVRTEWLWPTASIFDSMQVNFCFVVRATHNCCTAGNLNHDEKDSVWLND